MVKKMSLVLRMSGINKEFPGVKALNNMQLELERGEVHALLGENGAGKSTLIKILAGVYTADSGDIFIDGEAVNIEGITSAKSLGIRVVHQELSLCQNMSIADNVFLGRTITTKSGVFCKDMEMIDAAKAIMSDFGMEIDVKTKVSKLSVAQQQMVELARAMTDHVKILILDEPTDTLTDRETDKLFELIEKLKRDGISIIYISHRIGELFRIADRVTVLRDGCYIQTVSIKDASYESLVNMLVGRKMSDMYPKIGNTVGEPLMEVKNYSMGRRVKDCSFILKAGEILGFYGLVGAGRTELMRLIFGVEKPESGILLINGKEIQIKSPEQAYKNGITLVPEDRKKEGLILGQNVGFNITVAILKEVFKGGKADSKLENDVTDYYINKLSIKTPSKRQKVRYLSGGNQQKVVLSKNLATKPHILILDEPTRGIDVGAKKEIYDIIQNLSQEGVSIIMVSSEMPEIMNMCNRVIVMHEGRIMGEILRDEFSEKKIISLAMGGE